MRTMGRLTYSIIIHPPEQEGDAFFVEVPALPGCVTQGDTFEEALEMAREAVKGFVQMLRDSGEPVPEPDLPPERYLSPVHVDAAA